MKKLIIIMIVVFISGCATAPPPKLNGDHYQHFKCGFELDIPDGWRVAKEKPEWFPWQLYYSSCLSFFNNDISAFVMISCKNDAPLKFGQAQVDKIRESINKEMDKEKAQYIAEGKNRSCKFKELPSKNNDLAWSLICKSENELFKNTIMKRLYVYLYEQDTIALEISMFYLRINEEHALADWEKLLLSLHRDINEKVK